MYYLREEKVNSSIGHLHYISNEFLNQVENYHSFIPVVLSDACLIANFDRHPKRRRFV